jgi:hypothetical protein
MFLLHYFLLRFSCCSICRRCWFGCVKFLMLLRTCGLHAESSGFKKISVLNWITIIQIRARLSSARFLFRKTKRWRDCALLQLFGFQTRSPCEVRILANDRLASTTIHSTEGMGLIPQSRKIITSFAEVSADLEGATPSARFWSAAVPCRFHCFPARVRPVLWPRSIRLSRWIQPLMS